MAVQGEWWIQDGQAVFADGDIGDYNHEGYVIGMVQSQIADAVDEWTEGSDYGDDVDFDALIPEVAKNYAREKAAETRDNSWVERAEDDPHEVFNIAAKEAGVSDDDLEIGNGHGDAREYAMKKWGWQRMVDNNVETWNLTPDDMKTIAYGIGDAYGEDADTVPYNIYVYTAGKWANDIPLDVIEQGNPAQILQGVAQSSQGYQHGDTGLHDPSMPDPKSQTRFTKPSAVDAADWDLPTEHTRPTFFEWLAQVANEM